MLAWSKKKVCNNLEWLLWVGKNTPHVSWVEHKTRGCLTWTYHIATKISAIWLAARTSIIAVSVEGAQYDNIALQCKYEKKFKMADSQSSPENQQKRHVLVWVTATLLIKWKVNLRTFHADSETGTPCIDMKTFELNFQLNF